MPILVNKIKLITILVTLSSFINPERYHKMHKIDLLPNIYIFLFTLQYEVFVNVFSLLQPCCTFQFRKNISFLRDIVAISIILSSTIIRGYSKTFVYKRNTTNTVCYLHIIFVFTTSNKHFLLKFQTILVTWAGHVNNGLP